MPERQDNLLIGDILSNIENIFEFTDGCDYEQFISSKIKVYAVVRCFEIIGEAASLISEELKLRSPLVEWREMKNFRNRLIHDYFGIDYETVWQILKTDLPHNYQMLKIIS